jgi:two-component system response regulator FixJ
LLLFQSAANSGLPEGIAMDHDGLGRVFFVDDEVRICRIVCRTLEREGILVRTFCRAQECLVELEKSPCDLLITDLKMSGMDGIELLMEARRRYPRLHVLVLTAYGDVPTAVKALKEGAVDFIEKPFDRSAFLDMVRTMLTQIRHQNSQPRESLTKTEMTVLRLLTQGQKNREIAARLHRSARTVEVHRSHLMRKLGAGNVAELLRRASELGLVADKSDDRSETG